MHGLVKLLLKGKLAPNHFKEKVVEYWVESTTYAICNEVEEVSKKVGDQVPQPESIWMRIQALLDRCLDFRLVLKFRFGIGF